MANDGSFHTQPSGSSTAIPSPIEPTPAIDGVDAVGTPPFPEPMAVLELLNHLDSASTEMPKQGVGTPSDAAGPSCPQPVETLAPPDQSGTSDEQSIEQYMAELLQRTGCARTTTTPVEPDQPREDDTPKDASCDVEPEPAPKVERKSVFRRKKVEQSERRDTISTMRSLANMSARSALNTYWSQQLFLSMHSKLFIAGLSIVVSLVLVGWSSSATSLAFIGAVVAMLSAVVWGSSYFAMASQLIRVLDRTDQQADSQLEPEQADGQSVELPAKCDEPVQPMVSELETPSPDPENGIEDSDLEASDDDVALSDQRS